MTRDELDALLDRPPWQRDASCRGIDPELMYPRRGELVDPARAVCDNCPVIDDCLEYALAGGERFGIWGGMSERERRRIRRDRAA